MDRDTIIAKLPDHIQLDERLGEGGFASVYRVFNTRLQTHWALKILDASKMSSKTGVSKALKEAQITAKLRHPNVAGVYDVDDQNGFIFMELVDGPPLTDFMESGIQTWEEFRAIAVGILSGLAEAHRQGIVHGDISPRNILLTRTFVPKLVDFGLARHADYSSSTIGVTPGFASPEHVLNKKLTPQSDVFSAGAVLYQLATGRHPFEWQNYYAYSYAILSEKPAEPFFVFADAPRFLAPMLLRALATQPGYRFASAADMERAFAAGTEGGPTAPSFMPTLPAGKVLQHYHRGVEYYGGTSKQEMDWAEKEFRAALEGDPRFALGYAGLADVAIFRYMSYFDRSMAALAKAEMFCRQALDLDPERPETHRSLGRIHMMRREFPDARTCFLRAIELDPKYIAAHLSLGWCAVEAHDLAEAESAALVTRSLQEDNLDAALLLARIYYYRKDYDRSASAAEDALEIDRKLGRAYYDLAMAQRALGKFPEARASFEKSIQFQGDPNTRLDLGMLELFEQQYGAAFASFKAACQDETFSFLSCYYAGLAQHLLGNLPDARAAFERSREESSQLGRRDPTDPYPRAVEALAAGALGDTVRSRTLALMARELDPKDGLVAFYAACAVSWVSPGAATQALLDEALRLPRSPSVTEVSLDPHFARHT
jgi:tetratricopeptide (TPR) repeat protein/tRNA A-37 threonylcarbamoyl transferase component Bud32